MANANGKGSRAAGGYPPQQAGANAPQAPADPQFANQPGQPADAWQQAQGQPAYHPDAAYPAQGQQLQPPGYQYPQTAEGGQPPPAGQADPRYAPLQSGQGAQTPQSPYAPQFTPYTAQATETYQQQHDPAAGANYNPQGQAQGQNAPTPHTMENPAFPQHTQEPFHGQADPTLDASGYTGGGPALGQPGANHPDYLAHPDYAQTEPPFSQDPTTGFTAPAANQFDAHPGSANTQDPYAHGTPEAGGHDHGFEDDEYSDLDDAPSGGGINRTLLIVGVLVGAITVGGGLAYGWKTISGSGGANSGTTPVVRDGTTPRKIRPANPGGRQFENADAKIMGRLGGAGASTTTTDAGGTRKVPTVTITRDSRVTTPAGGGGIVPTQPNGEPVVSVPGLTVVDAFGAAGPRPGTAPAAAGKPIVVTPPGTKPKAKARPRVQIRNAPTKPAATAPAAAPVKTATRTPPAQPAKPKTTAPAKKKAAPPAPAASTGKKGYVAVLASVPVSAKSRMNALMRYADLQQKYGTLLANKTPDVREANLGERGKYHRLLVGPPGSRAQASALCSKLKAAGYAGCWVTSF